MLYLIGHDLKLVCQQERRMHVDRNKQFSSFGQWNITILLSIISQNEHIFKVGTLANCWV